MNIRTISRFAPALLAVLASPAHAYVCGELAGTKAITAADALAALRLSVGQPVDVDCGPQHRLPKTGLVQCSDSDGNFVDCAGTGQDGELQKGAPRAFVDNGDGTVTDRGTGLQWEQFDDGGGIHDRSNKLDQDGAYQKILQLNLDSFAGHFDWRLPNVFEQMTLGDFGGYQTGLYKPYFHHDCTTDCVLPNCACVDQPSYEWSSTSTPSDPSYAFSLRTIIGDPIVQTKDLGNYTARAVRGGWSASDISDKVAFEKSCADVNASDTVSASDALAILKKGVGQDVALSCILRSNTLATGQTTCFDIDGAEISCTETFQDGDWQRGLARKFTNNGDGTIIDEVTGLVWEVLSSDGSVNDAADTYTWEKAKSKIDDLNAVSFAGYHDWRMPNFFELQSLLNLGNPKSALYAPYFDSDCEAQCANTQCSCPPSTDSIWSSTFPLNNKEYAYKTDFVTGRADWALKSAELNVRGVRGGY